MGVPFPFTAVLGQDDMKRALIVAAVEPSVGGVLVLGDRGTGKSTAVRGLAAVLPSQTVVEGCSYGCDPADRHRLCDACREARRSGRLKRRSRLAPIVDLPLGAREDRVVGTLDLERALTTGEMRFEPGLLARANRGFLYVDEVNLLEDHIVDLLLDVAASGQNTVEREALSVRHPARFVLVGSCNPEEGELRPQLLDRFGLAVEIRTPEAIATRVEIVRRRDAYDADPGGFLRLWQAEQAGVRDRIAAARGRLRNVVLPDALRDDVARLCLDLGTDGLRGELTLLRAGRALAALDGKEIVAVDHLRRMAPSALRHRLRRDPLDAVGSTTRVERALDELWPA
ncbi:MAG: magnesium chelatase ATPase subunit I [Parafilimonas terrae]|nr:magnesium chelatase ATPase subunit I [Parafilimonas terrae]